MAIIFTSPKNKQRALLWVIIIISAVFLTAIFLLVLLPEFLRNSQDIATETLKGQSDATISLNIGNQDKVNMLEPFVELEISFAYVVQDKDGKQIAGSISAADKAIAIKLLEESGFKILSLKEMNLGNDNPFISY